MKVGLQHLIEKAPLPFWQVVSVGVHLSIAAAIVASVIPEQIRPPDTIEVDLVEPRLAAQQLAAVAGDDSQAGRAAGVSVTEQKQAPAAESQQASKASQALQLKPAVAPKERAKRELHKKKRAPKQVAQAHLPAKRDGLTQQRRPPKKNAPTPANKGAAKDADDSLDVAGANLDRLVSQVRDRRQATERAHAGRMAKARSDAKRVEKSLKSMTRAARYGGAGGYGGKTRGLGGKQGLQFYLSGRRVAKGRVVYPPQPISVPHKGCRIRLFETTPATVRMLVDRKGKVGMAYLKRSSGSRRFDRCAVRHAKAIRFKPGQDAFHKPLNVWIHVRVKPTAEQIALGN